MWIRNQERKGLVQVSSVDVKGNKIMCKGWVLGEYKTKQRCVEVLDEMHNHLNVLEQSYVKVFEMPKE